MFCTNCGGQIADGMAFCTRCGKRVEGIDIGQQTQVVHKQQPQAVPQQVQPASAQQAKQQTYFGGNNNGNNQGKAAGFQQPATDLFTNNQPAANPRQQQPQQPQQPVRNPYPASGLGQNTTPSQGIKPTPVNINPQPVNPRPVNSQPVNTQQPEVIPPRRPERPMPPSKDNTPKKKSGALKVVIIILVILLLAGLGVGGFFGYQWYAKSQYDKYIEQAREYLDNDEYEDAIKACEDAKKHKKDDAEVYLCLADAYVGSKNCNEAISVLENAYDDLEDTSIKKKLEQVKDNHKNHKDEAPVPSNGLGNGDNPTQPSTEVATTGATAPTVAQEETTTASTYVGPRVENPEMERTLRELMDKNLFYSLHMYHAGSLPTTNTYYSNNPATNLKLCDNSKFSSYQQYCDYVASIYEPGRAQFMISLAKYMGPDGRLYLNIIYAHPVEENSRSVVNAEWETKGYNITITSLTSTRCEFFATTTQMINGRSEEYKQTGAAVLVNGKWLLEREVY